MRSFLIALAAPVLGIAVLYVLQVVVALLVKRLEQR